jgi:hypothetical protein
MSSREAATATGYRSGDVWAGASRGGILARIRGATVASKWPRKQGFKCYPQRVLIPEEPPTAQRHRW